MNKISAIADKKDNNFHVLHRDKFATAINQLSEGRYTLEIKKGLSQTIIKAK